MLLLCYKKIGGCFPSLGCQLGIPRTLGFSNSLKNQLRNNPCRHSFKFLLFSTSMNTRNNTHHKLWTCIIALQTTSNNITLSICLVYHVPTKVCLWLYLGSTYELLLGNSQNERCFCIDSFKTNKLYVRSTCTVR